jgi:hypothetical protein
VLPKNPQGLPPADSAAEIHVYLAEALWAAGDREGAAKSAAAALLVFIERGANPERSWYCKEALLISLTLARSGVGSPENQKWVEGLLLSFTDTIDRQSNYSSEAVLLALADPSRKRDVIEQVRAALESAPEMAWAGSAATHLVFAFPDQTAHLSRLLARHPVRRHLLPQAAGSNSPGRVGERRQGKR